MQGGCQATRDTQTEQLHSIEHRVDDDSGHGNVKPDREGPASDAPVGVKAFSKGSKERNQNQRDNRRRQNCMSNENREISDPYPALPLKGDGADLVMVK